MGKAKKTGELKVGVATRDISPPRPKLLQPSGMERTQATVGVLDPLRVEALAVEAGGELAVLATSDLRTLEREWVFEIRDEVSRRTGCDPRRVLLGSVHNHCSSPVVREETPESAAALKEANRKIVDGFIEAAVAAFEGRRAAEIAYAETRLKEAVGENRRVRLSNGTCVQCWGSGGVCPPGHKYVGPAGPDSTLVRVLVAREVGAKRPFTVLLDYPSHPHLAELPYFSGEVPGAAKRLIEKRLPGATALYANSTGGNVDMHCVHPMDLGGLETFVAWFQRSQQLLGRRLADAAVAAAKSCRRFARPRSMRSAYASESSAGRGRETADPNESLTILSAVAVGDFAFVGMPGELFIELGLEIRAASPFKKLILVGYNGTGGGYVPKPIGFEMGGYEVMRGSAAPGEGAVEARPGIFVRRAERDAGDKFVAGILGLLGSLGGARR